MQTPAPKSVHGDWDWVGFAKWNASYPLHSTLADKTDACETLSQLQKAVRRGKVDMASWAIRMLLTPLLVAPTSAPATAVSAFIAHKMNRLLIIICEDLLPDLAWVRPILCSWADLNAKAKSFDWRRADAEPRCQLIANIVHLVRDMASAPHGHLFSMLRLVSGAGHADETKPALDLTPIRHLFGLPVWDSKRVAPMSQALRGVTRNPPKSSSDAMIQLLKLHDTWKQLPRPGAMHSKVYQDQFKELWSCVSRISSSVSAVLSNACTTIKNRDQPLFIYMGMAVLAFKLVKMVPGPDPIPAMSPQSQPQVHIDTDLLDKHTPRGNQREICRTGPFSQFSFSTSSCNVPETLASNGIFRSLQQLFQIGGLLKDAGTNAAAKFDFGPAGFHPKLIMTLKELLPEPIPPASYGIDWVVPRLDRLRSELELLRVEIPVAKVRAKIGAGLSPAPTKRRCPS